MTASEVKTVERIRLRYEQMELDKLHELKTLDKKVRRPALIFAYVFGIISALVLGVGMCFAMKIIGDLMILGIAIGIVGIVLVTVNYFIYKKFLNLRKEKYSDQIFELSDSLLNI